LPGFFFGQLLQFFAIAIAAWFGARFVARPIQELADGAARLGDNIDSPPIAEYGPTETRKAARIFNRMQEHIRAQLAERNRFLAAVSHDLRTPLTRMRLRVAQLSGDSVPEQHKLNDDIAEMTAMLDATLNYLRDDATEPWQRLDILALLESLAEDARETGRAVTLRGSAQPIAVQPITLRRCLTNLIDNALQYGEETELTIDDRAEQIIIEVRDNGPGIPENKMNAVFEPFVRLEASRNKNTGGVGLGLAIAREAAKRHGGTITLRNALGGGLIARLSIPRRA
jgi:protein-histidine pros-kinase